MATSTQTKNTSSQIDTAFEQIAKFNEQFAAAARKTGTLYLEAYEKAVDRAVELENKAADHAQQDWIESAIRAHSDMTKELTAAYTSTARSLLK
jgi:hypothetical protein